MLDLLKIEASFAGDPWLGSLPTGRRRALLGASHRRRFEDGESIYRLGDDADGIYGIVSDAVRMLNYPVDGSQLALLGSLASGRLVTRFGSRRLTLAALAFALLVSGLFVAIALT